MFGRKLILFGGKGGVGKTTLSSSLALLLSKRGRRVLLISTDPAHSLSDLFGARGRGVIEVSEWLHILEIDPQEAVREHIKKVLESLESLLSPDVFSQIKEVFHSVEETPGAEESAIIERLSSLILERIEDYDHFVVDTAPTGHTLQMLKTVGRVGSWIEELLRKRKNAHRFWEAGGSLREDRTLKLLEERRKRFAKFSGLILSPRTTFVPVLNPERLPIEETHRLVENLGKMGMGIELLIVNKVLPEGKEGLFLHMRKEQEKEYVREIEKRFRDFRKIYIPLRERDISSLEDLQELSLELGRRMGI